MTAPAPAAEPAPMESVADEEPTPMEVETKPQEPAPQQESVAAATTPKKRKKKKASYKNMMKGIVQSSSPSKDIEQEKEGLRKVTGGGAFSKIDKI